MPRPIDLAAHVQKLVEEKQQHTEALSRIDQMLDQIGSLLGRNGVRRGRKPGRPPAIAEAVPSATPRKRRRRRRFEVSGEQLLLDFIKQNKRPTTREINTHWMSEGRNGKADNTLSKMFKEKKLKRTPLGGGERGSKYSLA